MSEFGKMFDRYNRVARLYPALIALAPVLWTALALVPSSGPKMLTGGLAVAIFGCILYLLTSIARSGGKVIEPRLISKWGGWPTTILLRHRDTVIDTITKARYHAALSRLLGGIQLPSPAEERQSPDTADEIYRSATKRLIEARRGEQYWLLHGENASYGFRRNLLGLKPAALTLVIVAACLTGLALFLTIPRTLTWAASADFIGDHTALVSILIGDFCYILLFAFVVRPEFVFQAAREYAEALLKTLDNGG